MCVLTSVDIIKVCFLLICIPYSIPTTPQSFALESVGVALKCITCLIT